MPAESIGPWRPTKRPQPSIGAHPYAPTGGDQWPDDGAGVVEPSDWAAALQKALHMRPGAPTLNTENARTRVGGIIEGGGFGKAPWNPSASGVRGKDFAQDLQMGPMGRLGGQLGKAHSSPKPSPLKAIQQAILRGGAETGYNPTESVLPAPSELPGHSPNDLEPDADGDDGISRIRELLLNTVPQGSLDSAGPKFAPNSPTSPEPSFVGPIQPHHSRWGALGKAILRGGSAILGR